MTDNENNVGTELVFNEPLHEAVQKGNNLIRKIIDCHAIFLTNSLNGQSRSPELAANEEKLDEAAKLLMSTYKDLVAHNQYLMHYAIVKGNIKIVKLLANRCSVEAKNQKNMTAFCVAVNEDRFDILDYLLSLCENVNTSSNNYNDKALFYIAIIAGNIELVEKFLESNFPINDSLESSPDGWQVLNDHAGFTPLHLAVKYLRLDMVELLLSRGADVLKQNKTGSSALYIAFEAKRRRIWKTWQDVATNDKIIDTILDVNLGTSVKLTNRHGISHLHVACSRDRPEVIEKFLQENRISGNDFACCDNQGFSPLHFAAKYRCHKIAKVILRCDVDVNQRDNEFRTPLHIASKETSLELVQLLMQHGADLSLKDCHGNTPVHLAFNERNHAVLDLLLTDHTTKNSNPTDSVGISHFHIACTRNNAGLVRDFIDADESIVNLRVPNSDYEIECSKYNKDTIDWRGCVPLHFAIAFNRVTIIELLLKHGADVQRNDAKGLYPIHLAYQQNYYMFEELIEETVEKNAGFNQNLEFIWVGMQNKPGNVVSSVEKTKTIDYPRSFLSASSQINLYKTAEIIRIDWKQNRKEQIDIIKLLVKYGADLNVVDNFGNAPLYYIYDFNIHEILDTLSEKLDLDENDLGIPIVSAFLVEMYYRRSRLLKEIFKFKVNIDASYNNGSILHYICQQNEFWDLEKVPMVKYLLKKGANPDATDDLLRTPLHIVTECRPIYDNVTIIYDLLEANADVNAKMADGTTALHNLSCNRNIPCLSEMMRTLFQYNPNVNSADSEGRTPIFLACHMMNSLAMEKLLHRGADLNIEDHSGQTALCYFYNIYRRKLRNIGWRLSIVTILDILIEQVQILEALGLYISEKLENSTRILIRARIRKMMISENEFLVNLRKQIKILKNVKVTNQISLYDVLFMTEHTVSKNVIIIKKLDQILFYSKVSYIDYLYDYFPFVKQKYYLAIERRSLLPKAQQTLNHLLSTSYFPGQCSDFIFKHLTNVELYDFVKRLAVSELTRDHSKIKAYLRIRSIMSKYVELENGNVFVIDLIVRGSKILDLRWDPHPYP